MCMAMKKLVHTNEKHYWDCIQNKIHSEMAPLSGEKIITGIFTSGNNADII